MVSGFYTMNDVLFIAVVMLCVLAILIVDKIDNDNICFDDVTCWLKGICKTIKQLFCKHKYEQSRFCALDGSTIKTCSVCGKIVQIES